jgi:hypothetical protein
MIVDLSRSCCLGGKLLQLRVSLYFNEFMNVTCRCNSATSFSGSSSLRKGCTRRHIRKHGLIVYVLLINFLIPLPGLRQLLVPLK